MGKSVLTPEGNLLGKVRWAVWASVRTDSPDIGGKGIRANIPKPVCGELEAVTQLTTAGPRVV